MGDFSSTLEHDECRVIVGAKELRPEDAMEEDPVESLRTGTALRAMVTGTDLTSSVSTYIDDVLATAGHAKSFATLASSVVVAYSAEEYF